MAFLNEYLTFATSKLNFSPHLNFYLRCQLRSDYRDTAQKKRPFYFIVVADGRSPRDGKFIQKLGTYNPLTTPATIQLDRQRSLEWLHKGAQPTDTVRKLLSYKGVLYLKHLLRGVSLGLFDDATAMEKFQKWHSEHEADLKKRQEAASRDRRFRRTPPYRGRPERSSRPEAGGNSEG